MNVNPHDFQRMADWVPVLTTFMQQWFASRSVPAHVAFPGRDLLQNPWLQAQVHVPDWHGTVYVHMDEGARLLHDDARANGGPLQLPKELQDVGVPVLVMSVVQRKIADWLTARAPPVLHVHADWLPAADLEALVAVEWGTGGLPVNSPHLLGAFPDTEVAMCLSGGLRSLATGMVLFKRFMLDVYPATKVFVLTWRDPMQNYSEAALAFLHRFLGARIVECRFFEDDAEAVAQEQARVAAASSVPGNPGSIRFPYVTQMWFRRKYCNDMRRAWSERTGHAFAYVYRCRFDGFMFDTPLASRVTDHRCLSSVDISLLGTPAHADVECSLSDTYPEQHVEAYRRGSSMWEFGSEMHVDITLGLAGIHVAQNRYWGRFGRWKRSPAHAAPLPCECPALNTVAE